MKSVEERIARLEETVYFQEQTITALNEALTAQQLQMDDMQRNIAIMQTRLRALAPLADGLEITNEPPPHYNSTD